MGVFVMTHKLFVIGNEIDERNVNDLALENECLYGDGEVVIYQGQEGDPHNGSRVFNTREMDEARAFRRAFAR
jgi:hypothetical protein